MASLELTWLLDVDNEDESHQDWLAAYYREVANGPMKDYRRILQGGSKQGQNYFTHVLDGIGIFHKLRVARIVEINDLEEYLLFSAYTIHDMNKFFFTWQHWHNESLIFDKAHRIVQQQKIREEI